MSQLDISIRGLRTEEGSRRQTRQRLLEAFALVVVAALAADYSRGRMAPIAVLGAIADFGPVTVGTQSTQTLVVGNRGRAELRLGKVGIEDATAAAFFLPEDACSHAALASGATCAITIAFLPRERGPSSATLTVEDNSADSPHRVVLTGTGKTGTVTQPREPHAEAGITRTEVPLSADVGATATAEVRVTNSGDAPLYLVEVSFSGDRGDFAVDESGCAAGPVGAGGSCPLVVHFTPQRAGPQSATLTVAHDAHNGPLIVSLQGQGIGPPEGYCCVAGEVMKLDAGTCAARKGEFQLEAAQLKGRCAPPDTTPPPAPEKLAPGVPYENDPQGLPDCAAVTLQWNPVADPSEPVDYRVTLENGRGKSGDDQPTRWEEMIERRVVPGSQLDVSKELASVLDPKSQEPQVIVAPPLKELAAKLMVGIEKIHRLSVSFPQFRWRVSARDQAGNEGPSSEWLYFRCAVAIP